jgi:hypothetical protein
MKRTPVLKRLGQETAGPNEGGHLTPAGDPLRANTAQIHHKSQ